MQMRQKKRSLIFRAFCSIVIDLLASATLVTAASARGFSLNNDLLEVSFNEHGLASIRDLELSKEFWFSSDEFSMTTNNARIQSQQEKEECQPGC